MSSICRKTSSIWRSTLQIGSNKDREHYTMCWQLWSVSSSDSTVCSCNTMAHYLEPHTHTHTMGQLQAIRLVEIDPFPTLQQLPFSLVTNQNGGLAESVMWNRGSWLNTSNLRAQLEASRNNSRSLSCSRTLSQSSLTLLYPVYKHHLLHTHTHTHRVFTHTHLWGLTLRTAAMD